MENIWENISNKIAGEANETDEKKVNDWLESNKTNRKIFDRLVQVWQYAPKQVYDNTGIYRRFLSRKKQMDTKKEVTPFVYYTLRISAVLFFLVTSVFLVNYLMNNNNDELVYQQISVPKGSRSSFSLPDGTKVWLSNNSTISFPSKFAGKTRELELEGEAYFEVTHNKKKPFIVNIGPNRIKVLGTRFSVTAYPDDNEVRADLVEGKIQFDISNKEGGFNSYLVKPSNSLVLDQSSGRLYEAKVPDGFYDYWHNGIYEFRDETLEDLAIRIDRIYNTKIIFEDEVLKAKRFSGTISIDDNIFTFIEAVKSTSTDPIDYRYEKNKLYIKLK